MYDTTIILNELEITDAYKIYYVLMNDYYGLECNNDITQMLNIFDNNNYDCLDPANYDKFISQLLTHEYNDDNVTNEIINIINREVI